MTAALTLAHATAAPTDASAPVAAPLGLHLIAEFHGVDAALLGDAGKIAALLRAAADAAGARILQTMFHDFGLRHGVTGVTGVVMLAESHISIHTWPEHGYAAADIFMCGNAEPQRAYAALRDTLRPARCELRTLTRGAGLAAPPSHP